MIRLAAALALLLAARQEESVAITLREGVVGGFVPASERLRIEIRKEDRRVTVRMVRLIPREEQRPGKPAYETLKGEMTPKELEALVKEFQDLWALPTEDPKDGEDIYELDTILKVEAGRRKWANGAPSGCVHCDSKVKPSEEQKETFRRIVQRLIAAGRKHATTRE